MKKLIILFVIMTNFIFSQESKKGFSTSVKVGWTMANMYGEDAVNKTFLNGDNPETFYANNPASNLVRSGTNAGLILDYRFLENISFGIGANYTQKGARINATKHWSSSLQTFENVDGEIYWIQNYWTIELPIKVYFPIKENELVFQGGLSLGYLINSKEKGNIEISGEKYEYTNDRGANKNETGFLLGLGYNQLLSNKKNSFMIEFIWNRSLGKSYGGDMIPNPQRYYNQTFNLNAGYKFDFKSNKK